jgi:hypothetical protein
MNAEEGADETFFPGKIEEENAHLRTQTWQIVSPLVFPVDHHDGVS